RPTRAAGAIPLLRPTPADLREAVREGREGNLVLFAVDASGSMAARQRMAEVKTAVLSLLLDAYQRRDKVGLVTFRGAGATLALPPTSSVESAAAAGRDHRRPGDRGGGCAGAFAAGGHVPQRPGDRRRGGRLRVRADEPG